MNKKAQMSTVVKIAGVIFAFLVVSLVVGQLITKCSESGDENACRASVFARDKFNLQFLKEKTIAATPLVCSTKDVVLKGTNEQITKEIATLMDKCWMEFGNGVIKDPFKEDATINHKCFVCYTFVIKNKDYKITSQELYEYMSEHSYAVDANGKDVSHLQYIQNFGEGFGNTLVFGEIKPPEVYAIAYGAPTKDTGEGMVWGGIGGALAGVYAASLICNAGYLVCAIGGTVAVVGGTVVGMWGGSELQTKGIDILNAMTIREIHTIYVVPLNAMGEACSALRK